MKDHNKILMASRFPKNLTAPRRSALEESDMHPDPQHC